MVQSLLFPPVLNLSLVIWHTVAEKLIKNMWWPLCFCGKCREGVALVPWTKGNSLAHADTCPCAAQFPQPSCCHFHLHTESYGANSAGACSAWGIHSIWKVVRARPKMCVNLGDPLANICFSFSAGGFFLILLLSPNSFFFFFSFDNITFYLSWKIILQ